MVPVISVVDLNNTDTTVTNVLLPVLVTNFMLYKTMDGVPVTIHIRHLHKRILKKVITIAIKVVSEKVEHGAIQSMNKLLLFRHLFQLRLVFLLLVAVRFNLNPSVTLRLCLLHVHVDRIQFLHLPLLPPFLKLMAKRDKLQ